MSSSRREYHHHQEQQRRREQHATFSSSSSSSCGAGGGGANVNGHNKNAKWDSHLNNLLADLNTSVSDKQAMRSHGSPALDAGSSDCWGETRHFTCPDRDGTHVVQHNYRRVGTDALASGIEQSTKLHLPCSITVNHRAEQLSSKFTRDQDEYCNDTRWRRSDATGGASCTDRGDGRSGLRAEDEHLVQLVRSRCSRNHRRCSSADSIPPTLLENADRTTSAEQTGDRVNSATCPAERVLEMWRSARVPPPLCHCVPVSALSATSSTCPCRCCKNSVSRRLCDREDDEEEEVGSRNLVQRYHSASSSELHSGPLNKHLYSATYKWRNLGHQQQQQHHQQQQHYQQQHHQQHHQQEQQHQRDRGQQQQQQLVSSQVTWSQPLCSHKSPCSSTDNDSTAERITESSCGRGHHHHHHHHDGGVVGGSGGWSRTRPNSPLIKNNTNQAFSQESHQSMFTRTEQTGERSASSDPVRMKQNIQELDTILDELDQSKKRPGGSNFSLSRVDGAPSSTSTPYRSSSLRRHVDQTQDSSNSAPLASWTGNSRSPLRGLTAEVAPELQHAPDAGTTRVTRYEYRRCQRRQQSASPERRTPVPLPGSGRTRTEWHQAAVSTDAETEPDTAVIPRGLPSPPPAQPGTSTTINYHIYNYGRGVAGGDESRARSLSPVAAANANATAADTTVSKSYVYHATDHTQHHHHHHNDQQQKKNAGDCRDGSPTRYGKFPTVPLNGTGTTGFQHSVTTVERSMTDGSPLLPRRSPSPAVRRPRDDGPARPLPPAPTHHVHNIDTPRHVEQLMAHIPDTPQDGTYPDGPRRRDVRDGNSSGRGGVQFTVSDDTARPAQKHVTLDSRSGDVVSSVTSRPGAAPSTGAGSVTGRSVYYPPGSNQFQSTSESKTMVESGQTREGGKYKASSGYKASGRYKARAGSRETHAEGGATIPICLPLCCGGACNIM